MDTPQHIVKGNKILRNGEIGMENKNQFTIGAGVYSIMRLFAEFRVAAKERTVYCVGGCKFENEELSVKQDFFKDRYIRPLTDKKGNFAVEDYEWHKDNHCIELKRRDGNIMIYCLKPRSDRYFDVDHAVYNEKLFCNSYISDEDSREINGRYYSVVNPARTKRERIDPELFSDMRELFHTDEYSDITLKLFYVKDFEQRIFYMGLWDVEKQQPVSCDPSAPSNSDYSEEYALFFPN